MSEAKEQTVRETLQQAIQLAEICSEWNLNEVEIDGKMIDASELGDRFRGALQAELAKPEAVARDLEEAEQYLQDSIDTAPEPLVRLGQYLAPILDETQWPQAERLLLGAAKACRPPADVVRDAENTRNAFEKWASKRHGVSTDRWANSGKYKYDDTNGFWECWSEAIDAAMRGEVSR